MHICCAVVVKDYNHFWDIADAKCDDGSWDYFVIGGGFRNLIPVGKNCKLRREDENGVWMGGNDLYTPNPRMNYVNVARLRNVDRNELWMLESCGFINIFHPYSIIMEELDGCARELVLEDCNEQEMNSINAYLNDPRVQSYFIFLVDAHI